MTTINELAYIDEFGVSLKKLRQAAGLDREELATKMGTTKSVVSRIEESTGSMSVKFVRKYAKALGKKVNLELV
ncbi:MAG TPA: helix-turn-helix transcriptional regulator [Pyrinomonadaceae bacterium]|nr:helix-turn-helix transcriptional regulator [Acidobacteriota bacterium]HQX56850.1 helix-turn-helix transcriptional regulator [Pyrinomonadaceae bacterium]HQZ94713.1 helix-turn-helix transcriptional regulator [Pyrinomonadaceae bacterium]